MDLWSMDDRWLALYVIATVYDKITPNRLVAIINHQSSLSSGFKLSVHVHAHVTRTSCMKNARVYLHVYVKTCTCPQAYVLHDLWRNAILDYPSSYLNIVYTMSMDKGTAEQHILGRSQARNGRCWGDPGNIKHVGLVILKITLNGQRSWRDMSLIACKKWPVWGTMK